MTDSAEAILNFAAESAKGKSPAALVTLVEIRGGASRALGAQMAVRGDGGYCGYISGGCVEAAVAAEAMEAIKQGMDRYVRLGDDSRFFDIVLPCGGGITLAIHVLKDADPIRQTLATLQSRNRAALHYEPERQTLSFCTPGNNDITGSKGVSFLRVYRPKPRLILCGRGIELEMAKSIAAAAEFEVLSYDGRSPERIDDAIDHDTAVALLFHDIDHEIPFLKSALNGHPFYLGALGSRKTHEKRCQALRDLGYENAQIEGIKAPIGMFGPVRNAADLALSVMADVTAAYSAAHPAR